MTRGRGMHPGKVGCLHSGGRVCISGAGGGVLHPERAVCLGVCRHPLLELEKRVVRILLKCFLMYNIRVPFSSSSSFSPIALSIFW